MKRLQFVQTSKSKSGVTLIWNVIKADADPTNPQNHLFGFISWYSKWRRYVFSCHNTMLFDSECLKELTDFLDTQMNIHKALKSL